MRQGKKANQVGWALPIALTRDNILRNYLPLTRATGKKKIRERGKGGAGKL